MTPTPPPIFQVGYLERLPLGTSYPGVVAHVGRLFGKLPAGTELVIDITGVGKPIFEMFTYSGISPLGVLITAGTTETGAGPICSVPKLTLVSRLQALLHEERLKILRELAEAETLVRELQDFRVEFTTAGHLTSSVYRRHRSELARSKECARAECGADADIGCRADPASRPPLPLRQLCSIEGEIPSSLAIRSTADRCSPAGLPFPA